MRSKALRNAVIFLVVAIFSLASVIALAAEKQEKQHSAVKQWYVIKDSRGRCSVKQAKAPKKNIAGPFATREAALKAKAEKCPKREKAAKKEKPSSTNK